MILYLIYFIQYSYHYIMLHMQCGHCMAFSFEIVVIINYSILSAQDSGPDAIKCLSAPGSVHFKHLIAFRIFILIN